MKILELRAENIKNLKVIEIRPDGAAVILEGKNGAGKSAVLDSIFMALTGKKIDQPIRNGEARAEINMDLGTYKVRKIFTAKGERLEVLSAEGSPFKTPQTLLNDVLGNLSFDPLAFADMGKNVEGVRRQRTMLANLVGLDFTELDQERTRLYNERTIKNREIKGADPTKYRPDPNAPLPLESLVASMVKPETGTPREEISMAEELGKVETLEGQAKIHTAYEDAKCKLTDQRSACETNIHIAETEIAELEKKIGAFQERIRTNKEGIEEINKEIAAMAEPVNIKPEQITIAKESLKEVESKNKAIRRAVDYDNKIADLDAAKKVIAKLEEGMMKIDLEKDKRMKAARFPIEGLSLTDQFVTYQGKSFSQLSTGEQVRISTAVAMALNPKLKVILVREGSLLDKDSMTAISALAKDKDYQLWIERVADEKQVGVYLENGEIKTVNK